MRAKGTWLEEHLAAALYRWQRPLRWSRFGLPLLLLARAHAEDQVGYRHDYYQEQDGRVGVNSDAALVQKILTPWLELKADFVYDAISGATPIGAPPADTITLRDPMTGVVTSGSGVRSFKKLNSPDAISGASAAAVAVGSASQLPTAKTTDQRYAEDVSGVFTFGAHRLTPQVSYSSEKDYKSIGLALNYAWDLNQKNTTILAGYAHAFDWIVPNSGTYISGSRYKDSDDLLLGVSQLLSPKTVLGVNFTVGDSHGYLNDPYKGVIFEDSPFNTPTEVSVYEEKRPSHREKVAALLSLTQAISPLRASVEGSYRLYYDSYDILAHTLGLTWNQKLGDRVVVAPLVRYYRQSAASFYNTEFAGAPGVTGSLVPTYYSSDYRLSESDSFAYGVQVTVKALDWLTLDAAYYRYEMHGLDGKTADAVYPTADIITFGGRVWF